MIIMSRLLQPGSLPEFKGGGEFLVQRSIRGRAAEMGPKISLLVYWYNDNPLFSAKSGINFGHIFVFFF